VAQLLEIFFLHQQIPARLSRLAFAEDKWASMLALDQLARDSARQPVEMDPLTRSDHEAELERWLNEKGVENGWEVAPTLVNLFQGTGGLVNLMEGFAPEQLPTVIDWLHGSYVIYSLLAEMGQGVGRISEVVKALKAYSYMDQAPLQTVDLHESLETTLAILNSRLEPGVAVRREYARDLPCLQAYGAELNQVWTNLLDNALDAVQGQGEIGLRTCRDGEWAVVEIEDNGPGIPESILPNIFDPFFTTKPPRPGSGSGPQRLPQRRSEAQGQDRRPLAPRRDGLPGAAAPEPGGRSHPGVGHR
jgi:signal transduction histidine kinase